MSQLNTIARIENDFIFNAQYQLTAKEQKIILLLIANINPAKQKKFELQVIPVKNLRWAIMGNGSNGSFYEEMKKLAFRLVKKGIMFDTDVLIEGRRFPGYVNWFQAISPIKNDNGEVCLEFLFSEKLKPFLLELRQYVQIDIHQLTNLSSGFSIHLFQIFQAKRNQMLKYQHQTKLLYQLSELKKTLGIQDKYADWRNFKRKVIDLAIKEINQHTNINVNFKVIKKSGQVFSLEFEVSDKKNKTNKHSPTLPTGLHLSDLSFAQMKALKILTDYRITQELALEMIARALGSEINGFEDWYFEEIIQIFESKTNQKTADAKTGTLVNWFLKKKIFEQGDHFSVIMERLQLRKKSSQKADIMDGRWSNRMLAKGITADNFKILINTKSIRHYV